MTGWTLRATLGGMTASWLKSVRAPVAVAALVLATVGAVGMLSGGTPTQRAQATPQPSPVVFMGKPGVTTTARFATGSTWTVRYSYDCAATHGRLYISGYREGASSDLWPVNIATSRGGGSIRGTGAGLWHLRVSTTCDWNIRIEGARRSEVSV